MCPVVTIPPVSCAAVLAAPAPTGTASMPSIAVTAPAITAVAPRIARLFPCIPLNGPPLASLRAPHGRVIGQPSSNAGNARLDECLSDALYTFQLRAIFAQQRGCRLHRGLPTEAGWRHKDPGRCYAQRMSKTRTCENRGPLRPTVTARRTIAGVIVLALVALGLASAAVATMPSASASPRSAARHSHIRYYVSLGDSYAVGYQPSPDPGPTSGYTGTVARATHLRLANFGCGGATTASILKTIGCRDPYGPTAAAGVVRYPHQTQAAAAVSFIRQHRGRIGLITVSIGGNDITHCATVSNPTNCVISALPTVRDNIRKLASELRDAAGRTVPIVGLTYPDVLLGLWVYPPSHPDQALATLSVTAFRELVNPTMAKAYGSGHARFLDITKAAGSYDPLSERTTLAPYGSVPVAVARTCALTWYCKEGNIHATTAGYELIGRAVVSLYRSLTH
jgi:lysophospholipase L1-like esterase